MRAAAMRLSARHATRPPRLTRKVQSLLSSYPWPGNVRELRNVLEMLCLLRPDKSVRVADLPEALRETKIDEAQRADDTLKLDLNQPLEAMIERIIEAALAAEGGNRTRAAQRLGVSVRTLQRRAAQPQRRRG